jgi:(1->4)-alpha-D-glucan 1-alpha-D-glucosylmutase
LAAELLAQWPDERLKLLAVSRGLAFRRTHPELLLRGDYLPLTCEGPRADQICAFARGFDGHWLTVIVPRTTLPLWSVPGLVSSAGLNRELYANWFAGTRVRLPAAAPAVWANVLTDVPLAAETEEGGRSLQVQAAFESFPVALFEGHAAPH